MCDIGGSVLIETSKGDITIDLYTKDAPKACENFLKLCKVKYYNGALFYKVEKDFLAECGDVDKQGGNSVWGLMDDGKLTHFEDEVKAQKRKKDRLKHDRKGLVGMVNKGPGTNTSRFFIQLADRHIDFLDGKHTIFGEVSEGLHIVDLLNNTFVDSNHAPLRRFAIHHTYILEDPFPDPPKLHKLIPDASPMPLLDDDDDDYISSGSEEDDVDQEKWNALMEAREAKSREIMLEMVGDIADADMVPPKNVLFVCCLNPVTEDEDLELAFSRFGKISSCEILRTKDGTSLQYAFIEFVTVKACEQAYLKMENVRIDDRRIHVDFSQSVPRIWSTWMSGDDVSKPKGGKKGGGSKSSGSKGSKGTAKGGKKRLPSSDSERDSKRRRPPPRRRSSSSDSRRGNYRRRRRSSEDSRDDKRRRERY
eukprot:TRINITY_DN17012_c0_g1_i1.p1 TRINITY_DN17012_c0_g1~~TRINITY_DN17012_c0_g1_i1.p1  ORF type:complete len:422 (+),score=73.79 TRINITY_DN17012_c0_g1_i1:55-1320(+)